MLSEDDEPEIFIDLNGNKCESPLPDEVDENEIDNLLQEIELNPFEEVFFFYYIFILFISFFLLYSIIINIYYYLFYQLFLMLYFVVYV